MTVQDTAGMPYVTPRKNVIYAYLTVVRVHKTLAVTTFVKQKKAKPTIHALRIVQDTAEIPYVTRQKLVMRVYLTVVHVVVVAVS